MMGNSWYSYMGLIFFWMAKELGETSLENLIESFEHRYHKIRIKFISEQFIHPWSSMFNFSAFKNLYFAFIFYKANSLFTYQPKVILFNWIIINTDSSYAVLEIDTQDNSFYYYIGKIVHLLFSRSSFWRRCRGLPNYLLIIIQLEFCCSATKILLYFYLFISLCLS